MHTHVDTSHTHRRSGAPPVRCLFVGWMWIRDAFVEIVAHPSRRRAWRKDLRVCTRLGPLIHCTPPLGSTGERRSGCTTTTSTAEAARQRRLTLARCQIVFVLRIIRTRVRAFARNMNMQHQVARARTRAYCTLGAHCARVSCAKTCSRPDRENSLRAQVSRLSMRAPAADAPCW